MECVMQRGIMYARHEKCTQTLVVRVEDMFELAASTPIVCSTRPSSWFLVSLSLLGQQVVELTWVRVLQ